MDWYRTDADVVRHPHFLLFVRKLKMSKPAAFGHLQFMWACVAEHAETGHLGDTPNEVIEEWAEWPVDRAGEFVSALRSSGWLTPENVVAGWPERHAAIFKARENAAKTSKKQSEAFERPSRSLLEAESKPVESKVEAFEKPSKPTLQYSTTEEDDVISADYDESPEALRSAWNTLAERLGLVTAEKLSPKRRTAAKARIAEGLLARWSEFAAALEASRFHRGENDRGWRANFDWLCRPEKWSALIESAKPSSTPPADALSPFEHLCHAALEIPGGEPYNLDCTEWYRALFRGKLCHLTRDSYGRLGCTYLGPKGEHTNTGDSVCTALSKSMPDPATASPAALRAAAHKAIAETIVILPTDGAASA